MKQIYEERVKTLSTTTYYPDGTVSTQCTFKKPELTDGDTQKGVAGRMVTDDGGHSVFRPYNKTGESVSKKLRGTTHGKLIEYPKSLVLRITMEKSMSQRELTSVILDELDDLAFTAIGYINSLNQGKEEQK